MIAMRIKGRPIGWGGQLLLIGLQHLQGKGKTTRIQVMDQVIAGNTLRVDQNMLADTGGPR